MRLRQLMAILAMACGLLAASQEAYYTVGAYCSGSSGEFAPYLMGSLNHGRYTQRASALVDAQVMREIDLDSRFSLGFGVEGLSGYTTSVDYEKWDAESGVMVLNPQHPSRAWLQQAYVELKFRGVLLTVGMKDRTAALLNPQLSSGDLVESGNARSVPQVRIGFVDFQDIPLTNGWVQIQGEISYGKMMDGRYMDNHFNYYNYHLNTGAWYSYKRCLFRTKPSERLSVIAGMQVGAFFGGTTEYYNKGDLLPDKTIHFKSNFKTFMKMFLPIGTNGEDYYTGSSMGSWDGMVRYALNNDDYIYAYVQWPWEDGSSIGRRNKMDGVWGLEYEKAEPGPVDGIVLEYIDFRDQSGPIHWAPADTPGTTITSEATGRDNYYNNAYYNSYANYGMSMGTPFLVSPIYNVDGYPGFACTRACGVHLGLTGMLSEYVRYRALGSYQRGFGTYDNPYYRARDCGSLMLEADWDASGLLPGLGMRVQAAMDCGSLRGNSFGCSVCITYSGSLF